jgi:hypothetical protein
MKDGADLSPAIVFDVNEDLKLPGSKPCSRRHDYGLPVSEAVLPAL